MRAESDRLTAMLPELYEAYTTWKMWEKAKDIHKTKFFELIDAQLAGVGLARRTRTYPGPNEEIASQRARRHNPGWGIASVRPSEFEGLGWDFVLVEDVALRAFTIEHEGIKYARTVSKGPVMIDDDWVAEEDPELHAEVTFELPWGLRIARPIESLDAEALGKLTKFIYHGTPRASLSAPREVKQDD